MNTLNTPNSAMHFKKVFFSFFAVALILTQQSIRAQSIFQKAIGMEGFEKGSSLKLLSDGGFIITGETQSYSLPERDMLLLRVDSLGNALWQKTYGSPERETVNDVIQTFDKGYLFAAEKYQAKRTEGEHLTIVKADVNGNMQWKKIYDEGGNETEGFSMAATPDNGYVVTGMVKDLNTISSSFFNMSAEEQNLYLIKVDVNGNKLWSRQFFYGDKEVSSTGSSVIISKDGAYVITGNAAKMGKTDKKIEKPAPAQMLHAEDMRNMILLKVDASGKLIWANEYKINGFSMGATVALKSDGGFVVAGNTLTTDENSDIFLLNLAADGSVLWCRTLGGDKFESVADVAQTVDGGFVVSGMTESYGAGSSDVLNVKFDASGKMQWAKTYGGDNEDIPSKLAVTAKGIVTVGSTGSLGSESFDVLLMQTDMNGNGGNCITKDAKVMVKAVNATASKLHAAMNKVDEGIQPPNMKKPDAEGIREVRRQVKSKNMCH